MRRLIITTALTFIVVSIGILTIYHHFGPGYKIYDDGLWPVSVTIRSAACKPIRTAYGESFSSAEWAEFTQKHPIPPENNIYSARQDPFRGNKLAVPVPTSCQIRQRPLWQEQRYYQYTLLVVIVQYEDGKYE